jgi:geranylgeranyl diphosphate synthase type II
VSLAFDTVGARTCSNSTNHAPPMAFMTAPTSSDFLPYAETVSSEINAALDRYTQYGEGCPTVLREAIRYSLLAPGKRLRPLLVLMAAEACGCDRQRAMPAACAVEMIHTYSLIHDDLPVMDDDDWRRGRPSCHVKFGQANAILAGDALLAQAFEVISSDVHPPEIAAACCRELAHAAGPSELVGGQCDDLRTAAEAGDLAQLERIHRRKTGAMFRVALRLGAIIARANDRERAALDAFAEKLGLAFQIIDDLLDIKGASETLGKSTGKDARQGKLTFPIMIGIDASERRAASLICEARQQLRLFGRKAERLESLACFVAGRDR